MIPPLLFLRQHDRFIFWLSCPLLTFKFFTIINTNTKLFSLLISQLPGFPCLYLGLVHLLPLPHEISQHPHLVIVVLVEVEPVSVAESDLKEVVVKAFL